MARRSRPSGGNLFLTQVEQAVVDGLLPPAEAVLKRSKELVPLEDGGLSRAGRVEQDYLIVSVKYRHPIAWLQHERLDYEHDQGRQAKYLEQAVIETDVVAIAGRGITANIKGAG